MEKQKLIEAVRIIAQAHVKKNGANEDYKEVVSAVFKELKNHTQLTGNMKKAIKKTAKSIAEQSTSEMLDEAHNLADVIMVITGETNE